MDRHDGRPAAPPHVGEGPHAMWHFSEDPDIEVFVPQRVLEGPSKELEPRVWAVDTRHAPMFWFPRDCPRGCAWLSPRTTDEDRDRFFGHTVSTRIHVIEQRWLEAVQTCSLWAYRLPAEPFEPEQVGGYWSSRSTVEPLERVAVGDLLRRHADAGIELRITPSIWTWWEDVAGSTLEFSGSRLRNCGLPVPESLAQL
jgi:hypothetical protein